MELTALCLLWVLVMGTEPLTGRDALLLLRTTQLHRVPTTDRDATLVTSKKEKLSGSDFQAQAPGDQGGSGSVGVSFQLGE